MYENYVITYMLLNTRFGLQQLIILGANKRNLQLLKSDNIELVDTLKYRSCFGTILENYRYAVVKNLEFLNYEQSSNISICNAVRREKNSKIRIKINYFFC